MQASLHILLDGAIVRMIAPIFAQDQGDAETQGRDGLALFPPNAELRIAPAGSSAAPAGAAPLPL